MIHVTLFLLLVCAVRHFISHQSDQEYIIIKPRLLFLNETESTRDVQITCRQLPASGENHQSSLTILRRPFRTDNTTAEPEKLADVITSRAATTFGAGDPPAYVASGDAFRQLALTIMKVTCEDAKYTYICKSQRNRTTKVASGRIAVAVAPPVITLTASPDRNEYKRSDTLTLTCSSQGAIGLTNGPATLGYWVWEYNDVGPWLPAPEEDIVQANLTERGCFQNSTPTSLTVRVKDLKTCSRRFRCYVKTDIIRAVDDAQEREVSMGFGCDNTSDVIGPNPIVAIVGVAAAFVVVVGLTIFLVSASRRRRRRMKKELHKQLRMKVLSPLTSAVREQLQKLKEKQEQPKTPPTAWQSFTKATQWLIGKPIPEKTPIKKPTKPLIRIGSDGQTWYSPSGQKDGEINDEKTGRVDRKRKSAAFKPFKKRKKKESVSVKDTAKPRQVIIIKTGKRKSIKGGTGYKTKGRRRSKSRERDGEKTVTTKEKGMKPKEAVRQQAPTRGKEKKEMDVQTEEETGVQTEEHTGIQTEEQTSSQKNEPTSIQKSEQTSSQKSEPTSSQKSDQTSIQKNEPTSSQKNEPTSSQKSEQTKEEMGGGKEEGAGGKGEETPMARLMAALRAARSLFGQGEVEVRAVASSSVDGLSK